MSNWRDVFLTTPMRLTLRLVILFLTVSLLAFAATWWLANMALLDATETVLEQQINELSASGIPADIAAAVTAAALHADPEHLILQYDGPNGISGNYHRPLPRTELQQIELQDEPDGADGTYILHGRQVAGGWLVVGQDTEAATELGEVFIKVLIFTLLPTAGVVLAGGMFIALRSARRLFAIEDTLERLTAGDLTARLPALPGPPDDLTRVGAGIDRLAAAQEASVDALRQISVDIAHDLKTPIQRLAVTLDEARRAADGGSVTASLDRASAEIEGIVATFQALLRIAQIEGGSPRARFCPVDLADLARLMTELYEPAAEETGHRLNLTIRSPTTITGDRTLLGQVIANLLENALRHTPPGGAVLIAVDGTTLTIADHGPGIPEAEREAVLRRLYRLDRSRSTPGSGLGLALVDAIIRLHSGTLSLSDNRPGLRVEIRLPPEP